MQAETYEEFARQQLRAMQYRTARARAEHALVLWPRLPRRERAKLVIHLRRGEAMVAAMIGHLANQNTASPQMRRAAEQIFAAIVGGTAGENHGGRK